MHSRNCYRIMQLVLGIVLLAPLGCAHVDLIDWARGIPEATEENPVFNIVCVWEPSEGRNVDGMPSRGFAGQLFFFTRLSPTPVKVNGDVRIYVFDDQGTTEEQAKPIHQFDFLGDAWTRHLQDSTLGPSYNVFIPYTREGGWLADCQLRLRLTTESGEVVYSDTVNVALPGPAAPRGQDKVLADDTVPPHPVSQHLAVQLRPPVESIQYGATIRHQTVSPAVAPGGTAPPMPQLSAPIAAPQAAVAGPAPQRFRLAATDTAPPATAGALQTTHPQPTLPQPNGENVAGRFAGFGAVPGNWPQVRGPIIPATGGHPAVMPAGFANQPPASQSFQHQSPRYQSRLSQSRPNLAPAPQAGRYQAVVYQVDASGQSNGAQTNTALGGAIGPQSATAHPLGGRAVVRHPLADAIQ